jgi:uncharacterized membrane protein YvlD (DUF360 family)
MEFRISFWIIQTVAMMLTALFIPRLRVNGPLGAFLTVVTLALVNAHFWDAALFFSIPDSLTTRSLSLLFANGVLFWLLVKILPGVEISGILPSLLAPVLFTVITIVLQQASQHVDWSAVGEEALRLLSELRGFVTNTKQHLQEP